MVMHTEANTCLSSKEGIQILKLRKVDSAAIHDKPWPQPC